MASERLLIATSHERKSKFLCHYLKHDSPRFELQGTNDIQTLQKALSDNEITAVVADARMLASIRKNASAPGDIPAGQKPIIISPSLSKAHSKIRGNSSLRRRYIRDELKLFKSRLNQAIDQWRRSRSNRRLISGNSRVDSCGKDFSGPMAGFLEASAIDELERRGNPQRDRRQTLGCVAFQFAPGENAKSNDARQLSAAQSLRKNMRPCDLGIRWDDRNLVVLRPSSPLGECWLWADEARQRLDTLSLESSGFIAVAGVSIRESPMAGLCQSTIRSGVASAEHSAALKGGCIQTPAIQLLDSHEFWRKLRALPLLARRGQLVDYMKLSLGPAQFEHVGVHCELVSALGVEIAKSCGLDDRNIETVRLAGLYHDIGKLLVPDDILGKPGPLTAAERSLLRKHDLWGSDICGLLDLGNSIRTAVRDHHARFETSGYNVSLFGRIVSAADAIATMSRSREYRAAQPIEFALEELRRETGKQFDPIVVHAVNSERATLKLSEQVAMNN